MSTVNFGFSVRNSGALAAGLTPTWSALYKLSDGSAVVSPGTVAPITALGGGLYKIAYNPEGVNGELYGVVDAGAGITSASERYIEMLLAADSSRAARLDVNVSSRLGELPTPAPAGYGGTIQLIQGPLILTVEGTGSDGVLEVRRGDILTVRAALRSMVGQAINLQGATLAARIVGIDESDMVTGLAVNALQEDEGTLEVVLDTTDSALAAVRRARLIVTRTVGASDITSYPVQLLFEG